MGGDLYINIVYPNLVPLVLIFSVYYHAVIPYQPAHQGKLDRLQIDLCRSSRTDFNKHSPVRLRPPMTVHR
jgi:hypothetical protein